MSLSDLTATTQTLVHRYLQALAARDAASLGEFFAETLDWDVPGARELAPWLGPRHSRQEVETFFELLFANTGPVEAHLDHLLVDGAVAIVTGNFSTTMTQTGKPYVSRICIQLRVENGQIVHYRLLEDSLALVRALTPGP